MKLETYNMKHEEDKRSREVDRYRRGFTLLEALFSISILVTAVGGPLFLASRNISNGETARNEAIATYLAQESIEVLRKRRDDDALASQWIGTDDAQLTPCISIAGDLAPPRCTVDPAPVFSLCSGTCAPLRRKTLRTSLVDHLYRQPPTLPVAGSDQTIFTRTIRLIKPTASVGDREILASTTVSWQERGVDRSYTLHDIFFRN